MFIDLSAKGDKKVSVKKSLITTFKAATVLSVVSVISACAGQPATIELETKSNLQCGGSAGVSVVDAQLTIAAGEKPTPGYSINLIEQVNKNGHISLAYDVSSPREGAILPQMMTSPCLYVTLPDDWKRLSVTNNETGQNWIFEQK